jgi:Spy/CpxP family protein refolding chaperone
MRQARAIAILGGLLGVAAATGIAATPEAAPRHEGRQAFGQRLGLSPEQRGQMERLRDEFAKAQAKRRAELTVAHIELRELMRASQLDDKAIVAKARILGDLQAAQTRERIENRLAMAKVLTPEQREKFRGLMAERHRGGPWGRRGFFRDRQGRSGGDGGFWGGGHAGRPDGGDPAPEHE